MSGFYCPECGTNWWPYQAPKGKCPTCNTGTRRVVDTPDSGPISLRDQPPPSQIMLAALWKLDEAPEPEGLAA